MSLVISTGMVQTPAPLWLAVLGSWISTVFLLVFGGITFWQVLSDSTHSPAGLPIGLRVFVFRKLLGENYNPFLIMLIGALFAFSFDTFTQVALFSLSMSVVAGVFFSVILGMVFMCGMITSDGLNGFLVSALIQRAEKQSRIISRVIGFSIACFSVILGLMGVGAQGLF